MRRDTQTNWSTNNPILAEGEMGLEKDTGRWKVGNGLDSWNSLAYSNSIFSGPSVITDSSSGNALRITQIGTGNALVVEDSNNPDNTPFVIDSLGNVGIGKQLPTMLLDVDGEGTFSGALYAPTASVDTNTTQVATTAYVIGQGYLKDVSASATYLTQSSASTTYLSQLDASATYLTQSSASSNYLTQSSASSTYLTQSSASSTYLSQLDASSTYLTETNASSTYAPINSPQFVGNPTTPDPTNSDSIANKKYVDTILINQQLDSYSLVLSDAGKLIEMNSASANSLTVPADSSVNFDIGTSIDVYQQDVGQTTIVPDVGVTIRSSGNKLNLTGQYSAATLVKRGADDWILFGDLSL